MRKDFVGVSTRLIDNETLLSGVWDVYNVASIFE